MEYAKDGPEDVLIRNTVHNRGPEAASIRSPSISPLSVMSSECNTLRQSIPVVATLPP
jgi:hypothetical protein